MHWFAKALEGIPATQLHICLASYCDCASTLIGLVLFLSFTSTFTIGWKTGSRRTHRFTTSFMDSGQKKIFTISWCYWYLSKPTVIWEYTDLWKVHGNIQAMKMSKIIMFVFKSQVCKGDTEIWCYNCVKPGFRSFSLNPQFVCGFSALATFHNSCQILRYSDISKSTFAPDLQYFVY